MSFAEFGKFQAIISLNKLFASFSPLFSFWDSCNVYTDKFDGVP